LIQAQKDASDQQIFPEAFLSFPGSKNISSFDKLWMCLYCKLKDLCLDSRPSVRKSSGQVTLLPILYFGLYVFRQFFSLRKLPCD
jgi:hypothetical protein